MFHTSLQLPVLPTILGFLACGPISPVSKEACHMAWSSVSLCPNVLSLVKTPLTGSGLTLAHYDLILI